MDLDLPQHLDATRQSLMASLKIHPRDCAPSAPTALLRDLGNRFTQTQLGSVTRKTSFLQKLINLIASPAFGISAAAIMILGVVSPNIFTSPEQGRGSEGFRGAGTQYGASAPVQIVLIQAPSGVRSMIENSGDFEPGLVSAVEFLETSNLIPNPKVIVNFQTAELHVIDSTGTQIYRAPIPDDSSELSLAIAAAVTHL